MSNSMDREPFAIYLNDPVRMTLAEFEAYIEEQPKNGLSHELLLSEHKASLELS